MHNNAVNISDGQKVLGAMSRSFNLNIGTFSIKLMQKLCKNCRPRMIIKNIRWLYNKTTCEAGRVETIFDHVIADIWQVLPDAILQVSI
jgi:hypothetical protein